MLVKALRLETQCTIMPCVVRTRLSLSRTKTNGLVERRANFANLSFLTNCSDDSKPYIILKGIDESYK